MYNLKFTFPRKEVYNKCRYQTKIKNKNVHLAYHINILNNDFVCVWFLEQKRPKETKRDHKRPKSSFNRQSLELMELSD